MATFFREKLVLILLLASMALLSFPGTTFAAGSADEACLSCHLKFSASSIDKFKKSSHGIALAHSKSSPGGCVACHGKSVGHMESPIKVAPDVNFADKEQDSSKACLACHKKASLLHWKSGPHKEENLQCVQCHTIHEEKDPAMDRSKQAAKCTTCHINQHAESRLPSSHPIGTGETVCTDCHNPHGNMNPAQLLQVSVNENCLSCHAEMRGPFLFEHAPVSENCGDCHKPHGSAHDGLLKSKTPFLCQQCHVGAFHTSELQSGTGLPGGKAGSSMLGKNCLNCHSQVHGSNHPSGRFLSR